MGSLLLKVFFLALAPASLIPCWWLAGRVTSRGSSPLFRAVVALALALLAFLVVVNLTGRWWQHSLYPLFVFVALGLGLAVVLIRTGRVRPPWRELRKALARNRLVLLLAVVLAVPQALVGFSTNLWDEAVSSGIHLTGVNQIAEGIYPPRHNALPDIPIKYHYASIVLAGTVRWLTGAGPAIAIDFVSTGLWLLIFLSIFFWMEDVGLERFAAFWGAFVALLGGGLAWLFLPRLATFDHFLKTPQLSTVAHQYDPQLGWIQNLVAVVRPQSFHLRNADGTYSLVPLDVTNFLQQHPVPVGIALTVLAFVLFERWLRRPAFDLTLLLTAIFAFGTVFLGHAVYGAVACLAAGLILLGRWLWHRGWREFHEGVLFVAGVTAVAFLHGGLFAVGPEYGPSGVARLRDGFGYPDGGLKGFVEWNLAGFGVQLLLAVTAVAMVLGRRGSSPRQRVVVTLLCLFACISWAVPQVAFYTSSASDVEQFTEIAKFFFSAHTGIAVLSAFFVGMFPRGLRWQLFTPAMLAMVIVPLAFCYGNAYYYEGKWNGIYTSPYSGSRVEAGRALSTHKKGRWECFYDAGADERTSGGLSELLLHGGSVFTLTPSRYERTGSGFRLAAEPVAARLRLNSRVARLLPGAVEESGCRWLYIRPRLDLNLLPALVRSRFDKAVQEGVFELRAEGQGRQLFSAEGSTLGFDQNLERYWRPILVMQVRTDWDGDGFEDVAFFDLAARAVRLADRTVPAPSWLADDEMPVVLVGTFLGDDRTDLLLARMEDTVYSPGEGTGELVEYSAWNWSYLDSRSGVWAPEYLRWVWGHDVPLVADVDGDGFDEHLTYRSSLGQWLTASGAVLTGPSLAKNIRPVAFAGRFIPTSTIDLGLWRPSDGTLDLRSAQGTAATRLQWGGEPGDVLVPGDYDGDGLDELGLWRGPAATWFLMSPADRKLRSTVFGSPTGVPVPADYNGDGAVDLAVWEPVARRIQVSFDFGDSVGLEIAVPSGCIPLVVNMH